MKTLKQLPTIANVAAGNTVSIGLPVGNVYEAIVLYYTGATAAQLKNIKQEVNGRMVSEWVNGVRLESMNAHYNRAATDGALTIFLNRPELHQLGDRRFFGLDTNSSQGIQTANISLDIDGAAEATTLKAYAITTQSVPNVPNYLTKIRRFIVPVSAAGQFDIDNIPRPLGASIAAIHLYMADGADGDALCDITKAELLVDNVNWHDIDASIAADFQAATGKRTPQTADSTVIDLILDGDIKHALPLTNAIQDFRLRCTASAVGQVEVMVEYVDLWGGGRF
jgi:hypothetical protein